MQFEFLIVGIKLNLLNKEVYGYMVHPSDANQTLEDKKISFTHIKLEWFGKFSSNNSLGTSKVGAEDEL